MTGLTGEMSFLHYSACRINNLAVLAGFSLSKRDACIPYFYALCKLALALLYFDLHGHILLSQAFFLGSLVCFVKCLWGL